ncbi:hypothetical protein ACFVH6_11170 [Spirillospora sp. NPDC127200]
MITIVLALAVAGAQTWFKLVSREPQPGKKHALTLDDAVFWIEWITTAASTIILFLFGAAQQGKPIGTSHVFAAIVVLVLGGMVMPYAFRYLCYDGNGRIKGRSYVIIADAIGFLILLSSVAAGVKAYGT